MSTSKGCPPFPPAAGPSRESEGELRSLAGESPLFFVLSPPSLFFFLYCWWHGGEAAVDTCRPPRFAFTCHGAATYGQTNGIWKTRDQTSITSIKLSLEQLSETNKSFVSVSSWFVAKFNFNNQINCLSSLSFFGLVYFGQNSCHPCHQFRPFWFV